MRHFSSYTSRVLAILAVAALLVILIYRADEEEVCVTSLEVANDFSNHLPGCSQAAMTQQKFLSEDPTLGVGLANLDEEFFSFMKSLMLYDRKVGIGLESDERTRAVRAGIKSFIDAETSISPKARILIYRVYLQVIGHKFDNPFADEAYLNDALDLSGIPVFSELGEQYSNWRVLYCFIKEDIYDLDIEESVNSQRFVQCLGERSNE